MRLNLRFLSLLFCWPGGLPTKIDGPAPDLPYHALLIMEPYWVQQKMEMSAPRFTAQQLVKYITDCNQNSGAVTINLGIYQDGGVSEKALKVLTEVKTKVKEISKN